MAAKKSLRDRARLVSEGLKREYPTPRIALDHSTPLELLVATILSAQCTDARVNMVTPALFKRYRTARAYADADPAVFEKEIQSTGFFRQKTKSILNACRAIADNHNGAVPGTLEELVQLPGVGRKTANVVLGGAFGRPGIVVDTHVRRLSQRLGLTEDDDPDKIELDLQALLPEADWWHFSNALIFHGRQVCAARAPQCPECFAADICPSFKTFAKTAKKAR
jgi:endonuclease-3